jgi:hypothetical protein
MSDIIIDQEHLYENEIIECDSFVIEPKTRLLVKGSLTIHCGKKFVMMNESCIQGLPTQASPALTECSPAQRNAKGFSRAQGGNGGECNKDGQTGGKGIPGIFGGKGGFAGSSITIVANQVVFGMHSIIEMCGENGGDGVRTIQFGSGGGGGGGGGSISIEGWFFDGSQGTLIANGGNGGIGGRGEKNGENGCGGNGGDIRVSLASTRTFPRCISKGGSGRIDGQSGHITIHHIPDAYRELSTNKNISVIWTSPDTLLCMVRKNDAYVAKRHLKNVLHTDSDAVIEQKLLSHLAEGES